MLNNDRRVALVIGNSAYENAAALPNPERDANLVADALKRTGFETVTLLTNLRKDALVSALRDFAARAETADWAVVYYAGHGMEVGGINYLIPTDAKIAADRDIGFEAVPLEQVLNAAERAKKLRLVILDACRDNPFANQMKRTLTVASRSVSRGLAAVEPEAGTLVVYAAKDGETALDGDGINSPFASAFVKNLPTPGLEVRRLFDFVRDDVMEATGRKQKPFSYGSISGRQDFYFVSAPATSTSPSESAPSATNEPSANGADAEQRRPHGIKTLAMKGDRPSNVAPVAQRVVLYDEDPSDPKGKQYVGSVIWRTEPIKASGNQKPDIAVRADIEIPDRKFKMTMSFRRNTDTSLPASHTAELTFILPQDFSGGGVGNVPGILMKSNEQARGTPLAGLAVKVTDGFFLVGLSNVDADRARNLQLLKERSWFDVPLVYANQRRAIIAIEKGAPGERAFNDAFAAWGEDYPTASTDAQTRVQSFERTAASDARTSVQTYYSLTPDCNQSGTITVRVLKQPSQGTLEIARDRGFTNYAADNIRAKCNAQEVELTRVWYKSNADFKGRDQAQLEAFFTSGTSIKTTLQITVK